MEIKKDPVAMIYAVAEDMRRRMRGSREELSDEAVWEDVSRYVAESSITRGLSLSEKRRVAEGVFSSLRRDLDFLEKYIRQNDISEIMVNGCSHIFIERNGRISRVPERFPGKKELDEVIMRIGAKIHREINELNPILDARLEDGSRIHAVASSIAVNGPTLNIRKFPEQRIVMEELIQRGTITREAAEFLKRLVQAGYNIFISGGTSSGKTTFLNALSDYIPPDERVIVIEDSMELQLDSIENIVRLETRNANVQGKGEITMRQLIKASLRMRPDRILVGEVRGAEVVDMVAAMNTGHDGSLSTGHANSARGMLFRLESMFLSAADFPIESVRGQLSSAIDIIVHLGRLKDHSRKVLEITEVAGIKDGEIQLNPLYVYRKPQSGACDSDSAPEAEAGLRATGNRLIKTTKLEQTEGWREADAPGL
ncbi:MAG: CpaF family protein [Anaerovoracaceae bacterium]